MNKVFGISLAILAVAIATVPNFTDCASQGKYMTVMGAQLPMVCHWTARGEIAVGAPLFGIGAIMVFTSRKGGLFSLSALGGILGVLALLLPTQLVGTCGNAAMHCNTTMKPAIMALGGLTIVGSLGSMLWSRKKPW